MFDIFVEFYLFGKVVNRPVDFYSRKAALSVRLYLFAVLTLSAPYNGSVYENFASLSEFRDLFRYLIDRYSLDYLAAFRTLAYKSLK